MQEADEPLNVLCRPEETKLSIIGCLLESWALWNQYLRQILPQQVGAPDPRGVNLALLIPQRTSYTQVAAGTAVAKGL